MDNEEKGRSGVRPASKGKGKSKPQAKRGHKQKRTSGREATRKARERAGKLIPSRNVGIIASEPMRAQIVAVALQRPYAPSEYARESGVDLRVAAYHFRVLKEHGILEPVETVKVRGATLKHMYRATEAAFVSAADWGQLSDALRPGMAGVTLQDFNGRVTQAMETGHFFACEDICLYWTPSDLDDIAWREQVEIVNWCIEASENLRVETAERRTNGESEGSFHATFGIAAFPSPTHEEVKKHEANAKRKRKRTAKRKTAKKANSKRASRGKGKKP